ncbi:hypothetical protein NSQ91_09495 [Paenibacillus sp. FSL R7-0048]|uniref:hypothetical protein n=1 Tax=Paenibacillus TaxID=44249 RepID=UPI00096E5BBA|nr:hypothetical protein [Paenibacillus odorifer]OMD58790.1 hypothetical protein BSK48_30375 [Paenibacillus odorifer]
MYDKKRQLMETGRQGIKGEQMRMEIVYAPKGKESLASLVQYPPKFNSKYLCAVLTNLSQFTPKVGNLFRRFSKVNLCRRIRSLITVSKFRDK